MSDMGRINLDWALALVNGLASAGLQQVVISPGSRSTPLVLAASLQPELETVPVLDERCAAFIALGMARASDLPVALVATSGSAPGNWLPAVMEASESGVPLVLLSADRPWELQQCVANQTTDQSKLFGDHVRAFHRASEAVDDPQQRRRLRALGRQLMLQCRWPHAGPVHLDLPFREPLVPQGALPVAEAAVPQHHPLPQLQPAERLVETLLHHFSAGFGLVLCGEGVDDPREVSALAEELGAPLVADSLSGIRFGGQPSPNLITAYPRFLDSPEARQTLRPDWILQFGRLPLSAALHGALRSWQVENHWVVDPAGRWIDPLGIGVQPVPAHAALLCQELLQRLVTREEPQWLYRWRHQQLEAEENLPPEGNLVRQLLGALPDQSLLFCGNSLPIRWLDAWSASGSRSIAFHANRGLSGIDGNLSTFLGMARNWKGSGRKLALLGELTFQHDLGALANAHGQDLVVLVVNNGGGGIFDRLPQRTLPDCERLWKMPQHIYLAAVTELFGAGYRRLDIPGNLQEPLAAAFAEGGVQVLELKWTAEPSSNR